MTDKFMPLSQAIEGYDIFNKMQVQKVVFVPEHQWQFVQLWKYISSSKIKTVIPLLRKLFCVKLIISRLC